MREKWQPIPKVDMGNGRVFDRNTGSITTPVTGEIFLSQLQEGVFYTLLEHKGETVPNNVLLHSVWGYQAEGRMDRTDRAIIDKNLRRLRKKLTGTDIEIQTIKGKGKRLVVKGGGT
jgi:DNA-binding response OmpR family regulator